MLRKIYSPITLTAIWVSLWIVIAIFYFPLDNIGELGAYLSGVFSPLALFWFCLSYRLQGKELKLQREELTLQRKALIEQVSAQKGSQIALNNQVEILRDQSKRADKQLQIHIEDRESGKPLYIINPLTGLSFNCELYNKDMGSFGFTTSLLNIRAEARITLVEISHKLLKSKGNSKKFYIDLKNNKIQTLDVDSNFDMDILFERSEASFSNLEHEQALKTLSEKYLLECTLEIHYDSSRNGAGTDYYKFIRNDTYPPYSIIKI